MEPIDLCVRPNLCIVCKRRFWTVVELHQHLSIDHEVVAANISYPTNQRQHQHDAMPSYNHDQDMTSINLKRRNSEANQLFPECKKLKKS